MSSINKVVLTGNLTRDPELKNTANGVSVCNFTIAVNRRYLNPQGVREADFIPVVAWRQLAENCAKFLVKGKKCAVVGALQTRSYETQDGSKRYVTEVIADEVEFLSSPSDSAAAFAGESAQEIDASQGDLPF